MERNFRSQITKGLSWVFASQLVNQLFFVWFAIYLARILSPAAFGIVGLVTVISNYASFFVDLGFGTALVQRKDLDEGHLSTIFWFNLGAGVLLSALFFFCSPLLAQFYREPLLTLVCQAVSISFVISSLGLVQSNLLDKHMNFKRKVTITWVSTFAGYAVGIAMAWMGYGVWSLVGQLLSTQVVTVILLWIDSSWYPTFQFSFVKLKELLPFGLSVFGDTSINYWSRNADNFLIGKFIGTEGLGLYSRAYSLMLLPVRNISSTVSRVMFPAFSSIQEDRTEIRRIYLKAIRYIAFITFPAMAGLTVVSSEFVLVCFGAPWAAMIPILRWLAMLGAFQSILNLNGMIYNSVGKPQIGFKVSVVVNIVLLASFVVGLVEGGLLGVAIAYFVAGTVLSLPVYYIAIKQIDLGLKEVFNTLSGTIISTLVMAIAVFVLGSLLAFAGNLAVLISSVAAGMIVYVVVLRVLDKEFKLLVSRFNPFNK